MLCTFTMSSSVKNAASSKRRRPNTPTTPANPASQVPPFRSRRTVAQHAQANMELAGKALFLHRIVIICANHESKTRDEVMEYVTSAISNLNASVKLAGGIVSGIVVVYSTHSWMELTGPEYLLCKLKAITMEFEQLFKTSRILVFYNNANQRFTEHLIFRSEEPPVLLMKNPSRSIDQLKYHTHLLLRKIMISCSAIADEDEESRERDDDEQPNGKVLTELKKMLPEAALMDYVLENEHLLTFSAFVKVLEEVPTFDYYDEKVWPIPYDFTPDNVYEKGKYDVNLIFGNQAPTSG